MKGHHGTDAIARTPSSRWEAVAATVGVVVAGVLVVKLCQATAPQLLTLSHVHLVFAGLGCAFLLGFVVALLWLGRGHRHDDGGGWGGTGRDEIPDPPPAPMDELDREIEALLSGRWPLGGVVEEPNALCHPVK